MIWLIADEPALLHIRVEARPRHQPHQIPIVTLSSPAQKGSTSL